MNRCSFMVDNADVFRALVAKATPEQREAVRELARDFEGDLQHPRDRARFVVAWLRALGEDPVLWMPTGDNHHRRAEQARRELSL